MSKRTRFSRKATPLIPLMLGVPLCALIAASCAAEGDPSTSTGGPGTSSSGGGNGAGGNAQGGGSASSNSSSSSSGTMPPECMGDADCAGNPKGTFCDVGAGVCVGCLPQSDMCPTGEFCNPITKKCVTGCTDNGDCTAAPKTLCDVTANTCVECLLDTDCAAGTICLLNTCVPGCSATQPCQPGLSCCGSKCFDLLSDPEHCGDCLNICPVPANAAAVCNGGACTMGACNAVWANCDGDAMNGCEQNTLQDGPCVCAPGSVQPCYFGAPGTEGVGPCKAGTQACEASGLAWGSCVGAVLPKYEICGNGVDENCDGVMDNTPDVDGDGWTACNGDCCEAPGPGCTSPKLVNPGAFEVIGNGVDDDCDPATSDVVAAAACSTVADFTAVTANDVAKAMDICQTTTANPPLPQKKWGLLSAVHRLADGNAPLALELSDMQNKQTAILVNYGTGGIVPKKGPTMAGISSGLMRDQNDAGYVDPNPGTDLLWLGNPPAAYLAAHGGALPSSAGCSGNCPAGTGANDSVNVRFSIRVPTNAQSFSYDFRFVSSEYWVYSCTQYNDFYLALLTSTANGIPADKNISFDSQNNPVSVNNGFFDVCVPKGCYTCPAGSGELGGTGMQLGFTGGATKWLTTDAPVVPGETIQLDLMIFDVSDGVLDSLALLDNFRWNLATATVNTHE